MSSSANDNPRYGSGRGGNSGRRDGDRTGRTSSGGGSRFGDRERRGDADRSDRGDRGQRGGFGERREGGYRRDDREGGFRGGDRDQRGDRTQRGGFGERREGGYRRDEREGGFRGGERREGGFRGGERREGGDRREGGFRGGDRDQRGGYGERGPRREFGERPREGGYRRDEREGGFRGGERREGGFRDRDRAPGRAYRDEREGVGEDFGPPVERAERERPVGPEIPEDVTADELDTEIRAELLTLARPVAERVARHLVATGHLIDEDAPLALEHAIAARRLASRIASVREAVGLAAYRAGEWQTAISELRTYQRLTGRQTHLAVLADCERALGRPEKAVDMFRAADRGKLGPAEAIELLIVAAGARGDLGQRDAAVAMLQVRELTADGTEPWAARLRYAYADALLNAGRPEEAREWLSRAAEVDEDGETDAAERLLEMDGVNLEDDDTEESEDAAEEREAYEDEDRVAYRGVNERLREDEDEGIDAENEEDEEDLEGDEEDYEDDDFEDSDAGGEDYDDEDYDEDEDYEDDEEEGEPDDDADADHLPAAAQAPAEPVENEPSDKPGDAAA